MFIRRAPMMYMYNVLMRDEKERRKKEASKVKLTTRQSNTAHPRKPYVCDVIINL